MNIEQMTQKTREALQAAQRIAVEYSNNAVEQEHLLAALAQQQDGLIPQMLQTLGVDANAFANAALQKVEALPRVTGSGRDPEKIYISGDLDRALNAAEQQAKQMKDEYISVEHVFLGILQRPGKDASEIFKTFGITTEKFMQTLSTVRGNQRVTSDNPEDTYNALKKYGQDLVEMARANKLDPVIGTMACPVCGTALQPDDVWLKKGSSGWYTLSQCPVCAGKGGEVGRGVFQKYRMSRRDGLHWAFARCIQMPDDASLANWKRQRAQYLERQRIKAEKQAAEAAQNN